MNQLFKFQKWFTLTFLLFYDGNTVNSVHLLVWFSQTHKYKITQQHGYFFGGYAEVFWRSDGHRMGQQTSSPKTRPILVKCQSTVVWVKIWFFKTKLNQSTSRKLFALAGPLRSLRNFLLTVTKIAVAESLLLPILYSADVGYLDLTEE